MSVSGDHPKSQSGEEEKSGGVGESSNPEQDAGPSTAMAEPDELRESPPVTPAVDNNRKFLIPRVLLTTIFPILTISQAPGKSGS